jgi:methionine-rich copper-binding protein CopC
VSNFSGSGVSYSAIFTPTPNSTSNGVININSGVFTDASGNANTSPMTLSIPVNTVPADTSSPTVTNFSPADEAKAVAIGADIVLTFNEVVQRGTGNIVVKTTAGVVVATYDAATSSNLSINGSTLTINPSADLSYNTEYKVEFAAGSVKDVAGNNFAGVTSYNFSTDAQNTVKVSSGAVVSGVISQNTIWEGNITLSGSVKINPNVSNG